MNTKRIITQKDVINFFDNKVNTIEDAVGIVYLNTNHKNLVFDFNAIKLLFFEDISPYLEYKYNSPLYNEEFISLIESCLSIDVMKDTEIKYTRIVQGISYDYLVKLEIIHNDKLKLYFVSTNKLLETEKQLMFFNKLIGAETSMFDFCTWWINYDEGSDVFYSTDTGPKILGTPVSEDSLYSIAEFQKVRETAGLVSEFYDESVEIEIETYEKVRNNETNYFGGRTPVSTSTNEILWVESYGKCLIRYPDGSPRLSVAIDIYLPDLFDKYNQMELLSNLVDTGLISSEVGIWYHQRYLKIGRYYFTDSYQKLMTNGKNYKNETVIKLLNEQITIINKFYPEHEHYLHTFREVHNKVYLEGLDKYHLVIPNYKDDKLQWIDVRGTCVNRDENGDVNLFVGVNVDITDSYNRNRELELLKIQNEKLQLAENLAIKARNIMVWYKETHDFINARYIFGNEIFEEKLGIPRTPSGMILLNDLKKTFYTADAESKANAALVSKQFKSVFSGKRDSVKKLLVKHINIKTNEIVYLEHSLEVSKSSDNDNSRMVGGIMLDVTENILYQEKISFLANYDVLTETYNRNYFEQYIKTKLPNSYTILVLDLDGLKLTNDVFGHIHGDKVIIKASDFIKVVYKDALFISRIGGDEFVVLSQDIDEKTIREKADLLESMIIDYNESTPITMNISKGGITVIKNGLSFDKAFVEAENIMYRRKLNSRSSRKSKVLDSILETLNTRTEETKDHSLRLANFAVKTIQELGFTRSSEVEDMVLLSKVHDIGKITIPDDVLHKPDKLTKFEFELIKKHCESGYNIIRNITDSDRVCNGVLFHHEKWDGTGYPQGLKGDKIPLFARVISIVDTYDAMTNDRVYRKAISHEDTIKEILSCSGTQFDPEIVKAFIKACFN